jgi:hypothetical protein
MTPENQKKFNEQVVHLSKREQKLTRECAVLNKRLAAAEDRLEKAISALKRGLPHMNLGADLDQPNT